MRLLSYFVTLLFIYSCTENPVDGSDDPINYNNNAVIISLQDSDNVAIVKSENLEVEEEVSIDSNCSEFSNQIECEEMVGCMWHNMENGMSHCMADHDHDMENGMYQPHDIAVDNINGYWFTTAMMGTKVIMYSVEDNKFIASYNTNSMPALLDVDEAHQKIYVSGGNSSMGETNKILELAYNENSLELIEEWNVQFTYAHGIHFDEISGYVFAVSKTTDFIARFNPNDTQNFFDDNPVIASMDSTINTNFSIEPRRLWPIEISGKYPYLFITCSAGDWSAGSEYQEIPGQVQMWHMEDMNLIATYEFDTYSRPWHIEVSPTEDKFYVSLAGDGENGSSNSGVACIEYSATDNQYSMNQSWIKTSSEYGTLHGITLHSDCDGNYHIYSTGRTDGNIYKFDAQSGEEIGNTNLVSSGSVRTGGIDSFTPPCNTDCSCD